MAKKLDKYKCIVQIDGRKLYKCRVTLKGLDMRYGQINWEVVKEADQPFLDSVNEALGSTFTVNDFGRKPKRATPELITVLVVDDDDKFRSVVCSIITSGGYRALSATNGKEALELLVEGNYGVQLILLDLSMPVMSGWEFLKHRNEHQTLKKIPVIVQTGEINPIGVESATAILSKPYSSEVLLNLISDKLRKCA